ncbi:hypothetical protein BGZ50_002311 [Haplosporangium sp. Z 11]|nr:hypothetical protein BGZ50_002311 [Haplosporangium sp. Z 11]
MQRKLNDQPRSIVPSPTQHASYSSVAPTGNEHRPIITIIDDKATKSTQSSTPKNQLFWNKPGMNALLDWLTVPENDHRLNTGKISGTKIGDLHKEIAEYVNKRSGTTWKADQVKTNIRYARDKYRLAKDLTNTTSEGDAETETLRERMLAICPAYDRLYAVYENSMIRDPSSPRQSVSYPGEEQISDGSDRETSDLDEDNAAGDASDGDTQPEGGTRENSVAQSTTGNRKSQTAKRRKVDHLTNLKDSLDSIKGLAQQTNNSSNEIMEARKDLRRREQAQDEREKVWAEKMMDRERKHDEMLAQRWQEFDRMLAQRRQEFEQEKAEYRAEVKQEKAEVKQEREMMLQQREDLVRELVAVKKELEIRDRLSPPRRTTSSSV